MKKLELKHLAPYLPYELVMNVRDWIDDPKLTPSLLAYILIENLAGSEYKPILRPLTDITKEIEHNRLKFIPYNELNWDDMEPMECFSLDFDFESQISCPLFIWNHLFQWHFDVFGLIEQGLAVDINTLGK